MDLNLLRSFQAVAESHHLTRAAERLHLSQPAVSAHIKALEAEFGVNLFERLPGGMALTVAGRRLLGHAEQVLTAADSLRAVARDLRGELSGHLHIGTLLSAEFLRVGELLARTQERYPLIALDLKHELSGELVQSLHEGRLDAGFFLGGALDVGIGGRALRELRYRVAIPADWAPQLQNANWKALADATWVATPANGAHRRMIDSAFRQRRIAPPSRIVEADEEGAITHLAVSGVGLALMRDDIARKHETAGRVVIRADIEIRTSLWFIHRAERAGDPLIQALLEVLALVWPADAPSGNPPGR